MTWENVVTAQTRCTEYFTCHYDVTCGTVATARQAVNYDNEFYVCPAFTSWGNEWWIIIDVMKFRLTGIMMLKFVKCHCFKGDSLSSLLIKLNSLCITGQLLPVVKYILLWMEVMLDAFEDTLQTFDLLQTKLWNSLRNRSRFRYYKVVNALWGGPLYRRCQYFKSSRKDLDSIYLRLKTCVYAD